MKIKHTIVNANENSLHLGDAYYGDDKSGSKMRKLSHRELALLLIDKYAKPEVKTTPSKREYVESFIVDFIDVAFRYYKPDQHSSHTQLQIDAIAMILEISPVTLYNDPDLPEFLRGQQSK